MYHDMACVSEHVASTATILSALLFIDVDVFITYSVVSRCCIEKKCMPWEYHFDTVTANTEYLNIVVFKCVP